MMVQWSLMQPIDKHDVKAHRFNMLEPAFECSILLLQYSQLCCTGFTTSFSIRCLVVDDSLLRSGQ